MRALRSTTFCMRASQTSLERGAVLVEHAGHTQPLTLGLAVLALALGLDVVVGLRVLADHALVVAQDDLAGRLAIMYCGMTGVFPPPPMASMM